LRELRPVAKKQKLVKTRWKLAGGGQGTMGGNGSSTSTGSWEFSQMIG